MLDELADRTELADSSEGERDRLRESPMVLDSPAEVKGEIGYGSKTGAAIAAAREAARAVIRGVDRRLLVVVGPCSLHSVEGALEYAHWIAEARDRFADELLVMMRAYVEKPRTRLGWQGLISDPYLDGSHRIDEGIRLARTLLRDINELGVPVATEFLNPAVVPYLEDLVSWGAIGARTSESQLHRQLASGLACPVGFKNRTDGDLEPAIGGLVVAAAGHRYVGIDGHGRAAVVSTPGNADCHLVLRGGRRPNYDEAAVGAAAAALGRVGRPARLMVDLGHGNRGSGFGGVASGAAEICRQLDHGSVGILGVMIESNLVAGSQPIVAGGVARAGQSVTDACIGLAETDRILASLSRSIRGR